MEHGVSRWYMSLGEKTPGELGSFLDLMFVPGVPSAWVGHVGGRFDM